MGGIRARIFSKSEASPSRGEARAGRKSKSVAREYAEAIVLAIILALIIRTFVIQAFKIPTGSMLPTLQIGDHILVLKFIYGVRLPFVNKVIIPISEPKHGDVIVFVYPEDPSKDFIKRVVAVGGDTVEIRDKKLYINNKQAPDEHAYYQDTGHYPMMVKGRDNYGPKVVPANHLFVMGDNRDSSHDSRFFGFVELDAVKGKAFIIYWSWDSQNGRLRWERLADIVH